MSPRALKPDVKRNTRSFAFIACLSVLADPLGALSPTGALAQTTETMEASRAKKTHKGRSPAPRAAPPPPASTRAEASVPIACCPPQGSVVRGEPLRQELPNLFRLLRLARVLIRQQHDFPAAMIARSDNERGRACRIAVLGGRLRQLPKRVLVHKHVDHKPGFVEDQILKGDPELLANAARCSVAGDHVVRRHRPCLAVIAAQA
jgi:hypothetical protein